MVEEAQTTLSAEEAGAFVAQWAEQNKVSAVELANRLGIDDSMVVSFLRQGRGRLSMERWLLQHQAPKPVWRTLVVPVAIAFVIGGVVGCFVFRYLLPDKDAKTDPAQDRPVISSTMAPTSPSPSSMPGRSSLADSLGTPGTQKDYVGQGNRPVAEQLGRTIGERTVKNLTPGSDKPVPQPQGVSSSSPEDLTGQVKSPIPDDLEITMNPPDRSFVIRGPRTLDPRKDVLIQQADVIKPLQEMARLVLEKTTYKPKPEWSTGLVTRMDLDLSLAQVHRSTLVRWNDLHHSSIHSLIDNASDKTLAILINSLLVEVHETRGPSVARALNVHSLVPH